MEWININNTTSNSLNLSQTHPNHLSDQTRTRSAPIQASFQDQLLGSLNQVNADQQLHQQLAIQSVVDPESVNAHDVTIAASQADLSLRITKNIVDRVISAYREITSIR